MLGKAVDVKILCAGNNWMRVGSLLAIGLDGYYSELPAGSTVAAITGSPGEMLMNAPRLVAEGNYHMAITTPAWYLKMAVDGKGPFRHSLPLRAIAVFPHDDRLALAVRKETGLQRIDDIKERKYPLKISMPIRELQHPAGWVVEEILKSYGMTLENIESWGGEILKDLPRFQTSAKSVPIDPKFDAIFDEAIMARRWWRVSQEYDLTYLKVDESVIASLENIGMKGGVIEKGRLKGVMEDVPTIDFSGWILFCREDMPYELGYLTLKALDEQHENITSIFSQEFSPLTSSVDMLEVGKNTLVPLHDGVEAYYKEKGYL